MIGSAGFREYHRSRGGVWNASKRGSFIASAPNVPGLTPLEQDYLRELVDKLVAKGYRNRLRRRYYFFRETLKDLGLTMPPSMERIDTVLGWPAKAVDSMVRRVVLDQWITPGEMDADSIGLTYILESNRLDTELPGTFTASLMHGVAFGFVTAGDQAAGEPDALLTVNSAENASAVWDTRRRSISRALSVTDYATGQPSAMTMYLPGEAITMRRDGQKWDVRRSPVPNGDVPVEALPYRPLLDRPFGRSRISRPVMTLTDSGVRTLARTEVGAEFYNAPQRYALGADEDAFKDKGTGETLPGWKIVLGHMLTLNRDADGNVPAIGQFPQQSMQPNIEQYRMIAQVFAAETSLPLRSLGVVGDNPESADAISEANRELELEIRDWQKSSLTPGLRRLMARALYIVDPSVSVEDYRRYVYPHWQRPDTVSLAAATDAVTKLDGVAPGFGQSEVGLEMAGLEAEQIARFRIEQARLRGSATLSALGGQSADSGDSGSSDATELKTKFDALGIAIRAGVNPADAARQLGLGEVGFTGAVPVSLRLPESEAGTLEEK